MIQIYGASDDVVVVKGDITEEFTPSPEGELILGFSTGHAVRIRFTDSGVWRIESCTTPKLDTLSQAPEGDEDIYSDRATILAPVRWVVAGREAVFLSVSVPDGPYRPVHAPTANYSTTSKETP